MKLVLIAPPMTDDVDDTMRSISMEAERECPPLRSGLLVVGVASARTW